MDLKQFKTEMETLGYNINYLMFTNPPQLPYMVYYVAENNYQYSDNKNYSLFLGVNLELYDKNKNIEAESKIENKFNELGLTFSKDEVYIESEKLYQVIYYVELI